MPSLMWGGAAAEMKGRPKQVSGPLNERVRASLCSSSGSEHDADDPDSACLLDLVNGIIDDDDDNNNNSNCSNNTLAAAAGGGGGDEIEPEAGGSSEEELCNSASAMLDGLLLRPGSAEGSPEWRIRKEVTQMIRKTGAVVGDSRRCVVAHLRALGYNAGLCKARWGHVSGGIPAGDYEYVDVLFPAEQDDGAGARGRRGGGGGGLRLIVEVEFAAQFRIARPSAAYARLVAELPEVAVAPPERLKAAVKIVCNCAKKSLKKSGMYLPPWRKHRYMQAKWFAPYKRSTNQRNHNMILSTGNMKQQLFDAHPNPVARHFSFGLGLGFGFGLQPELGMAGLRTAGAAKCQAPGFVAPDSDAQRWSPPTPRERVSGGKKCSALALALNLPARSTAAAT